MSKSKHVPKQGIVQALKQYQSDPAAYFRYILSRDWELSSCFWEHGVPGDYLTNLFSGTDDLPEVFCKGYFKQPFIAFFFSPRLTRAFLEWNTSLAMDAIRRNQAFLNERLWSQLVAITEKEDTPWIQGRMREFEQLRLIRDQVKERIESAKDSLKAYEIIELLSLIAIFWEKNRLETLFILKKDFHAQEHKYAFILGKMLRQRLQGHPPFPEAADPDTLHITFFNILARCKKDSYWGKFEEIATTYNQEYVYLDALDKYCYRNHQLIFLDERHFQVVPPDKESEIRWDRIGQQYRRMSWYYNNLAEIIHENDVRKEWERGNPETIFNLLYWKDLGFPHSVKVEDLEIYPTDIIQYLSALDGNQRTRYLAMANEIYVSLLKHDDQPAIAEVISGAMLKLMSMDIVGGPLCFRTEAEFLTQTQSALKGHPDFSPEKIAPSLDFLSWRLDEPKTEHAPNDLFERPFLRFGNMVCWIAGVIGQKNHAVWLQNRIMKHWYDQKDSGQINLKSAGLVDTIAAAYKAAQFEYKKDVELRDSDNALLTDVDLFAWKAHTIFVIQIKDTYARHTPKSIVEYRDTLEHAGRQLDISMDYIEQNRGSIKKRLGITLPLDQLQFYPLIVTSTPEGNYERWGKRQSPKISIWDLNIILSNSKALLYDKQLELLAVATGNRAFAERFMRTWRHHPGDEALEKTFFRQVLAHKEKIATHFQQFKDLWKDPHVCTAEDVIEAIEQDKV